MWKDSNLSGLESLNSFSHFQATHLNLPTDHLMQVYPQKPSLLEPETSFLSSPSDDYFDQYQGIQQLQRGIGYDSESIAQSRLWDMQRKQAILELEADLQMSQQRTNFSLRDNHNYDPYSTSRPIASQHVYNSAYAQGASETSFSRRNQQAPIARQRFQQKHHNDGYAQRQGYGQNIYANQSAPQMTQVSPPRSPNLYQSAQPLMPNQLLHTSQQPTHLSSNKYMPSSFPPHEIKHSPPYNNVRKSPIPTSYNKKIMYASQSMYPAKSEFVYEVQFKMAHRPYTPLVSASQQVYAVGDFVMTNTHQGDDLGIVTDIIPMAQFVLRQQFNLQNSVAANPAEVKEEKEVGVIIRLATAQELDYLKHKHKEEMDLLSVARDLVDANFNLMMRIVEVEYQFDRKKVTVYYDSDDRVDFRDVVRQLNTMTDCRVWMRKINKRKIFIPKDFAKLGLATGEDYYLKG